MTTTAPSTLRTRRPAPPSRERSAPGPAVKAAAGSGTTASTSAHDWYASQGYTRQPDGSYVSNRPEKSELAEAVGIGMIGVGGFGWLAVSNRAAGPFGPLAVGFVALMAVGFAFTRVMITPDDQNKVAAAAGVLAPGAGLMGGVAASMALGLTGGAAALAIAGGCLLGLGAYIGLARSKA